jgi:hypothetical protein
MPPIAAIIARTMAIFLELPDSAELIEDIADDAADDADEAADDADDDDDDDDSTIIYNYCMGIL